jgi:phosphotransferase system  glucose/maltose/N-acetylglucosamine-specific IIC component
MKRCTSYHLSFLYNRLSDARIPCPLFIKHFSTFLLGHVHFPSSHVLLPFCCARYYMSLSHPSFSRLQQLEIKYYVFSFCVYLHVTRVILYILFQIACWFCSGQLSAEFYSKSHPLLYSFFFPFILYRSLYCPCLHWPSVELLQRTGFS